MKWPSYIENHTIKMRIIMKLNCILIITFMLTCKFGICTIKTPMTLIKKCLRKFLLSINKTNNIPNKLFLKSINFQALKLHNVFIHKSKPYIRLAISSYMYILPIGISTSLVSNAVNKYADIFFINFSNLSFKPTNILQHRDLLFLILKANP